VLCEKPMALGYRECLAMIRACRRAGRRLGIAYYRRFYPIVRRMKELLERGSIGAPVLAEVLVAERFDAPGAQAPRRWLLEKKRSGGGPMMDLGSHRIDLLIHLLGEVRSARGELRNLRFTKRSVEDHATAVLAFAGDGERRAPTAVVTATHCLDRPEDRFVIYGTEGTLEAANLGSGALRVSSRAVERTYELPPHPNLHAPLVREFNLALLEGRDPMVTGDEGARASRVLDRIYGRTR
jgi:predicted dehydrogenase